MRRVLRVGFVFALIVALIAAFSFSLADESAPRRLCEREAYRYGFKLARQGALVCAPPKTDGSKSVGEALKDLRQAEDEFFSASDEKAPRAASSRVENAPRAPGPIISIFVNHPHHAPPSEN